MFDNRNETSKSSNSGEKMPKTRLQSPFVFNPRPRTPVTHTVWAVCMILSFASVIASLWLYVVGEVPAVTFIPFLLLTMFIVFLAPRGQ